MNNKLINKQIVFSTLLSGKYSTHVACSYCTGQRRSKVFIPWMSFNLTWKNVRNKSSCHISIHFSQMQSSPLHPCLSYRNAGGGSRLGVLVCSLFLLHKKQTTALPH